MQHLLAARGGYKYWAQEVQREHGGDQLRKLVCGVTTKFVFAHVPKGNVPNEMEYVLVEP